ncbi:MAG: PilN domain-containing protein [Fimbriimonadales bacterium]
MPYVNLIQEQRQAAQANERQAKSFFFLFVGVLVTSGIVYGLTSMDAMFVSRQAHTVQEQNKKNAPIVKRIDQNALDLAALTPRLKTLEDAAVITSRWDRILTHLTTQTPPSAWLTGVRCSAADPTKSIQVSFAGVAAAQSPIGEFILRLQNLKDLDNVNLKFTNEKVVATSRAVEFQVDADLAGTAEQKVKKEAEGDAKP